MRNGRRSTIDWTAESDDDASSASATLEAWIAAQPPARSEAEWEDILGRLRDAMRQLADSPLIRRDRGCQEILARLGVRSTLEEVDAAIDEIGGRLDAILAGVGHGSPAPAPVIRGPAPLRSLSTSDARRAAPRRAGFLRSLLNL